MIGELRILNKEPLEYVRLNNIVVIFKGGI